MLSTKRSNVYNRICTKKKRWNSEPIINVTFGKMPQTISIFPHNIRKILLFLPLSICFPTQHVYVGTKAIIQKCIQWISGFFLLHIFIYSVKLKYFFNDSRFFLLQRTKSECKQMKINITMLILQYFANISSVSQPLFDDNSKLFNSENRIRIPNLFYVDCWVWSIKGNTIFCFKFNENVYDWNDSISNGFFRIKVEKNILRKYSIFQLISPLYPPPTNVLMYSRKQFRIQFENK